MTLLTRLGSLFEADAHAVLDKIEDPLAVLKQAVRDMEIAVARDQARLLDLEQELDRHTKAAASLNKVATKVEEELSIVLDHDEDDLARNLIRRKLETAHNLECLATQHETLEARISDLCSQLEQQQSVLLGMRQKVVILDDAESRTTSYPQASFVASHEDIEVELLKAKAGRAS